MKKYLPLILLLFPFLCQGQITPKGVKVTSGGLKLDSAVVLANGQEQPEIKPFLTGVKLQMGLRNIHGLSIKDDKSFPGISMRVLDKAGKEVLNYADLLAEYKDGILKDEAKYFVVSLTIGAPMAENETYTWSVRVWDKNAKNDFVIEVPLTVGVPKDMIGIKKIPGGLTCEHAIVMDTKPLTTNHADLGSELYFVASGVKGFTAKDGRVKMGAGMVLKDAAGNLVLEYTDMLKDQEDYDEKDSSTLRLNLTLGEPMMSGQDYTWMIKVWDKTTGKKFEASCVIHVN
jgi:hypothetical protein